MSVHRHVLNALEAREAADDLERAIGWTVLTRHRDHGTILNVNGSFTEPAAALEWAATTEAELNAEGEDGFTCTVFPIRPAD